MKLKNNLYRAVKSEVTEKGADYTVSLNSDCIIYKAHFPEQPVTPGVCIVEMGHELLEEHLECELQVKLVKNVKFLSVISPLEVKEITYQFSNIQEDENGSVKVQMTVVSGETVYAKISMTCQK